MRYHARDLDIQSLDLATIVSPFGRKFAWFLSHGYKPHLYQVLFHCNLNEKSKRLSRFRAIAAGRRGGKSLSGAEEALFYALHPDAWWEDFRPDTEWDGEGIWGWVLNKDHVAQRPTYIVWKQVLKKAGLVADVDYVENKTLKTFTFPNGSLVEFKSATDPDKLRGAGLHFLWVDEASYLDDEAAWRVVRPALGDHLGAAWFTMTPNSKNWAFDEFWGDEALNDPNIGAVQFWSIDNPYYHQTEWEYERKVQHPSWFKQEYCADFNAMTGKELKGEWLHYWDELPSDLDKYIGVDPAISQKKGADRFAIAVVGVSRSTGTAYLIDQWAGQLSFPEQALKIQAWHAKYRPMMIGVEANAYQSALAQVATSVRTMPPIAAIFTKGQKADRIIGMSPLFKLERVLIQPNHKDFIDEWLDYDSSKARPKDDCLDSVCLALQIAGALLPEPVEPKPGPEEFPTNDISQSASRAVKALFGDRQYVKPYDDVMGSEW